MFSYGPPHMTEQKQGDQLEPTYSSSVRIRDVALMTSQKRRTIGRSGERRSVISVGRHDMMMMMMMMILNKIYATIRNFCGKGHHNHYNVHLFTVQKVFFHNHLKQVHMLDIVAIWLLHGLIYQWSPASC